MFLTAALIALNLSAQTANTAATPPVPAQITAAKKVFVSNAGADPAEQLFSGGDNRPYDDFYAALQTWGRYQLTSAPAGSDLIFKLRFTNQGTFNGAVASSDPTLHLEILDPATGIPLTTIAVHFKPKVGLKAARDKNFDQAIDRLIDAVKQISSAG